MLSAYRVLDLTDDAAMFAGYVLAHLGAEVIAVEPPEGADARRLNPTAADGAGLWWEAYARGKQSVALDLDTDRGQSRLEAMVASADVLIESFDAPTARRLRIDPERFQRLNPGLVTVSITPFGRTGPKAEWPATDLTVWAACGAHILAGDEDRAPVRTSVPQSFLHAGADAAGAILIALQERHHSALGQHIDVSAQQSAAQAALAANLTSHNNTGMELKRIAGGVRTALPIRMTWPCRDGYVAITLLFGPAFTEPNRRLLAWVHEAGWCSAEDAETDWATEIAAVSNGMQSADPYLSLCDKIEQFTLQRTQQELFDGAVARGLYIAPTLSIEGLLREPQFQARDFWQRQNDERLPGAFAKFSATPLAPLAAAPPLNRDADVALRRAGAVSSSPAPVTGRLPLDGLKVLDFMWVIAGPFFTRVLSDFGATVIKVESSKRMEPARGAPAFLNGEITIEHGVPFANFNAGKLGITVDPGCPEGRALVLELVRWADVVTESFSPKAMAGWGLDYDTLKSVNPNLIMISSCLMGQTGPRAQVPGYGNMAAAVAGFYDTTGWQDRSPAGPYLAYTDGVAPRFMVASLLAALEHRRTTGQGQHIDLAQAEAAIHFLAPAVLDFQRNSHLWSRMGNRDRDYAPHGVFGTAGDDRWIAVVCQHDEAWRTLCRLAGWSDYAADPSLGAVGGRRAQEDAIEARLSAWCADQDAEALAQELTAAGIAAHPVQNSDACAADPQLKHRGAFVSVPHASLGDFVVEAPRALFSRTPGRVLAAAPELGQHNVHVLKEILGYTDDRIADLYAALALE